MWKLLKTLGLLYLLRNMFSIFNKAVFILFLGGLEMGISTVLLVGDLFFSEKELACYTPLRPVFKVRMT